MINLIAGITARILSNSYLNVFQKLLTLNNEHPSVVNFYTYLGLSFIGIIFCPAPVFSIQALPFILIMGLLGAFGNYFIIKALSCGELSTIAPINSYKPLVALIFGIFLLNEIPVIKEIFGILLLIFGTLILTSSKFTPSKAYLYRVIALICSGTEAIFIKKVILLTNMSSAFLYWACAGFLFSLFISQKHPLKIFPKNIKFQLLLVLMVAIMQYSTNYVFSKMNTASALALFQLSSIVSVFLGVKIFNEKNLLRKLISAIIMGSGACVILM